MQTGKAVRPRDEWRAVGAVSHGLDGVRMQHRTLAAVTGSDAATDLHDRGSVVAGGQFVLLA